MKKIRFIDLFCGAGGATTGLIDALNDAGIQYEGVVVNHWNIAIQTHTMNHPEVKAVCSTVENIQADEVFEKNPMDIDVGWASPTCTHFSLARGGKPCSNQQRSQPEMILPYLRLTRVKRFYVENVPEFVGWGPLLDKDLKHKGKLYKAGRPDPRKIGWFFNDWIRNIKRSGYRVEHRVLNAADFGAPTTRRRLIVQMVRNGSGEKIVWPEPTHVKNPDMFTQNRWRPAREIIDWSIPGNSIFARKKPLADNTLKRIAAGIEKYWGEWAKPFLMLLRSGNEELGMSNEELKKTDIPHSSFLIPHSQAEPFLVPFYSETKGQKTRTHSVDEPLPTVVASKSHIGVVEPFFVAYHTEKEGEAARTNVIGEPLPTLDCANRFAVVEPLFIPQHSAGTVKPVTEPLSTVATTGSISMVEGFITAIGQTGGGDRCTSEDEPLRTVTTKAEHCLVQPLIISHNFQNTPRPVGEPLPTCTTVNHFSVVEPLFIDMTRPGFRHEGRVIPGDEPMRTVTTHNNFALATPLVVKYYGNEKSTETVDAPLGTVTTKDRFGLIAPRLVQFADGSVYALDILFRMLQPEELAAAMSFPENYQFAGNKGDKVKRIGNAVCPKLSQALLSAVLKPQKAA